VRTACKAVMVQGLFGTQHHLHPPMPGTLLTLKAIVRMASDMLIISCRSFASLVALTRNSSRLSPTCAGGSGRHYR
jgi:hypothetical protein